jgi:hypothetical protein
MEIVLAVREEIQHSEVPEQSVIFQGMFHQFNTQYVGGRLPDYRILLVYDVWYWVTERCARQERERRVRKLASRKWLAVARYVTARKAVCWRVVYERFDAEHDRLIYRVVEVL